MTEAEKKDVHGFISNLWQKAKSGDEASTVILRIAKLMSDYCLSECNEETVDNLRIDIERLYNAQSDTELKDLIFNASWAISRTQEGKRCHQ